MTTEVENEAPDIEESKMEESRNREAELQAEVEQLVAFKSEKVKPDNLTPCPACMTYVKINANQCPNCDSNIAANNALIRESLRRLAEITGDLDEEHEDLSKRKDKAVKRSFGERLKGFFSGSQEDAEDEDPGTIESASGDPRILDNVVEGDQLKVLERHGAWYKVKMRDGQTGWIYSTIVRER